MSQDKVKVIRVTATEFELNDGRTFEHPIPYIAKGKEILEDQA